MTLVEETRELRRQLRAWACNPEWSLMVRYELLPQVPFTHWWQWVSFYTRRFLRVAGLSRQHYFAHTWRPALKHAPCSPAVKPLLIWAVGSPRESLRPACAGMAQLLRCHSDVLPVLVTDVADFAFYSRLGWLVEYLSNLPGEGHSYLERKRRYLAWRYRNALAVPLSAGMADRTAFDALMVPSEVW